MHRQDAVVILESQLASDPVSQDPVQLGFENDDGILTVHLEPVEDE